jgi:hypothetical protein
MVSPAWFHETSKPHGKTYRKFNSWEDAMKTARHAVARARRDVRQVQDRFYVWHIAEVPVRVVFRNSRPGAAPCRYRPSTRSTAGTHPAARAVVAVENLVYRDSRLARHAASQRNRLPAMALHRANVSGPRGVGRSPAGALPRRVTKLSILTRFVTHVRSRSKRSVLRLRSDAAGRA